MQGRWREQCWATQAMGSAEQERRAVVMGRVETPPCLDGDTDLKIAMEIIMTVMGR